MMTEDFPRRSHRVLIIGGGITGLAAAHRFTELARERGLDLDLRLVESGPRLGGVLRTERSDGFLLEAGPDSFITQKPEALDLCRRLGLESQIIGTDPSHRRSFVARGGRLLPVPEGFQMLAPSRLWPFVMSPIFSWPGKLRMALDWVLPARTGSGDESLGQFVERRLGREALERMAQPMIAGVYGADPHILSLQATLPRFQEMERRHGSVIRAMVAQARAGGAPNGSAGVSGARYGLFVTLQDGMQTLVDTLAARLPSGSVHLGTSASHLSPQPDGTWRVRLTGPTGSEEWVVDAVCLALPSHRASLLIEPFDPGLGARLAAIPYASVMTYFPLPPKRGLRSATTNILPRGGEGWLSIRTPWSVRPMLSAPPVSFRTCCAVSASWTRSIVPSLLNRTCPSPMAPWPRCSSSIA
jgi:oxygen-dependent protoporphyrinogen oxidase